MSEWNLPDFVQRDEYCALIVDEATRSFLQEMVEGIKYGEDESYLRFHRLLHSLNKRRLSAHGFSSLLEEQWVNTICAYLEEEWLKLEREKIAPELENIPTEPEAFIRWFEDLEHTGYGQNHPLFSYLADRADREEFRYFFQQESYTEAGFDDLVAMTQVKASPQIKMEMASNYWDEMGRGNPKGVHGFLLQRISDNLQLCSNESYDNIPWAPLALSNSMIAFATKRMRVHQSIGALGSIELTAPGRCTSIIKGLKRIGVSSEDYHYYTVHESLDRKHWAAWRDHVVKNLLIECPESVYGLAEGALIRLHAGNYCFDAYSKHLQINLSYQADILPEAKVEPEASLAS